MIVQTNMPYVGQDDKDVNDMEDYDSNDSIMCREQGKDMNSG